MTSSVSSERETESILRYLSISSKVNVMQCMLGMDFKMILIIFTEIFNSGKVSYSVLDIKSHNKEPIPAAVSLNI